LATEIFVRRGTKARALPISAVRARRCVCVLRSLLLSDKHALLVAGQQTFLLAEKRAADKIQMENKYCAEKVMLWSAEYAFPSQITGSNSFKFPTLNS
jgi:hypothetical protein